MATAYTSLLGLALPVTGELSGTWGDTVNNSITSLLDSAIAGTTNVSTDADVTLTTTTGAANTAREAILLFSGARTALRTVTAPAQSKIYTVINATTGGYAVKLVGSGPTTGLTIPNGASATVAWNGSDFIEIGTASIGNLTVNGNLTVTGTSTLTGAITNTAGTANGVAYLNGSKVVTSGSALTFDGTSLGLGRSAAFLSGAGIEVYRSGVATLRLSNITSGQENQVELSAETNGPFRFNSLNSKDFAWALASSEQMRLTSTGLGIGTSSPAAKLDVKGGAVFWGVSTTSRDFEITSDASFVQLQSYNSKPMKLNAQGNNVIIESNLGLGVTPSAWSAYKAMQFAAQGVSVFGNTSISQAGIGSNGYYNGTNWIYNNSSTAAQYLIEGAAHKWYTAASGTAGNAITFTQALTLDASGRLGIATTSPVSTLDVRGNVYVQLNTNQTNSLAVQLTNQTVTSNNGCRLSFDAYNIGSSALGLPTDSESLAFYTGGVTTERARIDSSGNLLVGTTSSGGSKLTVQSGSILVRTDGDILKVNDAADTAYWFRLSKSGSDFEISNRQAGALKLLTSDTERARIDSSGNLLVGTTSGITSGGVVVQPVSGQSTIYIGHITGTGSGASYSEFYYAGTNIGSITQSGTTAVLFNVTSDQRLKDNIVDAPEFGSVIDSIKVRSYDWKADGTHQRAGFVAQELVTVAPEAVHQPTNTEDMMAVDYSKLVPMLVKEIQSLRKRLADAGI